MAEFALDLDHEAITLMRRDGSRWERLGAARLDAPDFDARLRDLQGRAATLARGALATELVIPPSQVLHIEHEMDEGFEEAEPGAAQAAVAAAIHARTSSEPGAVAFDWMSDGRWVLAAVVSTETLREADGFARAYGFNPARAVARPDPDAYPAVADFGPLAAPEPEAAPEPVPLPPPAPATPAHGEPRVTMAEPRPAVGEPKVTEARSTPRPEPRREEPVLRRPPEARRGARPAARRTPKALLMTAAAAGAVAVASAVAFGLLSGDDVELAGEAEPPVVLPGAPTVSPAPEPRPFSAEPVVVPVPETSEPEVETVDASEPEPEADAPEVVTRTVPVELPEPEVAETAEVEVAEPEGEAGAEEPAQAPVAALEAETPEAAGEPEAAPAAGPSDGERASYAATGIWRTPPAVPAAPAPGEAGAQPVPPAVAPGATVQPTGPVEPDPRTQAPAALTPPPPPGTEFALGPDGRVAPAPDGTLTPDGITLFAGEPPRQPPARAPETIIEPGTVYQDPALAGFRPPPRPETRPGDAPDAAQPPTSEEAPDPSADAIGTAVADALREAEEDEEAEPAEAEAEAPSPDDGAAATAPRLTLLPVTARDVGAPDPRVVDTAVASSLFRAAENPVALTIGGPSVVEEETAAAFATVAMRPRPRPADVPRIAREAAPAPVVTASAQPAIPTRASVARRATVENALSLNRVSLVGVFGAEGARRALVRLPSGRFKKVKVGDRLDGGRVRAIQDGRVIYVRGGRSFDLRMPRT